MNRHVDRYADRFADRVLVKYPSWEWFVGTIPNMKTSASWYMYLRRGFIDLGCTVITDERLDKFSASREGEQYTAIEIHGLDNVRRAIYDWSDFDRVFVNHPWYKKATYWKIQARADHQDVLPIGQTVSRMQILDSLPALRAIRGGGYDVVFLGRNTDHGERIKAARLLKTVASDWNVYVGVANHPRRDPVPADVRRDLLKLDDYMKAIARARVVVALPGVGGDWTWRHTEALAVGTCLVTLESNHRMPGDYAGCWAVCHRDLSDLCLVVNQLLGDEQRRLAIAAKGRQYYDTVLAPAAMAQRMILGSRGE